MHNIFCGGVVPSRQHAGNEIRYLNVQGANKNINLKIQDIHKSMVANIPAVLMDLLEVASYVHCADQHIKRGGEVLADMGKKWRRELCFVIPVRQVDLWNSAEVKEALTDTLEFLSDDHYSFEFVKSTEPLSTAQEYFEFGSGTDQTVFNPDEVALFSGGLDSFAGAVEDLMSHNKKLALVGHRSAPKVYSVQKELIKGLQDKGLEKQLLYIPIEVTKQNNERNSYEYTQRTRSFLFASLAMTIAHLFNKSRITFYENGVVSLNLPIGAYILGARATRTTHPRVLRGFERIFSALLDKEITIDTPYQWKTKAAVIQSIARHDCQHLLGKTNSCTRPHEWTKQHNHCGICSQCIDRRFGLLAAGLGEYDPAGHYKVELLLGSRDSEQDIVMAADYVKFAREISDMSQTKFLREYPQVTAAVSHFPNMTMDDAVQNIYNMMQSHAADVNNVIKKAIADNIDKVASGTLPQSSILAMVMGGIRKIEVGVLPDMDNKMAAFMDSLEAPVCEFAVDEESKRIVFAGGFYLENSEYFLIKELLPNFHLGKKTPNGDIAFISAEALAGKLFNGDQQSLRQSITRFRKKIQEQLAIDQGITLDTDGFIENKVGHGYRLNKNLKEVLSIVDLDMANRPFVTT